MNTQASTQLTPSVGDFLSEKLWTDTVVYEVVGLTRCTIKVRRCARGEVVKHENYGGNPYPCIWREALPNPEAGVLTVRRRKDGTFRRGTNPLRPAHMIDGKPVDYTDYRE